MGKVIAIVNQKGGVGKTTTAVNLGASFSILEFRTLVIDADPQANATSGLGFDPKQITNSVYEALVNDVPIKEAIVNTEIPNLDLLPSHLDLVGAEIELINHPKREHILSIALEDIVDDYDYIFIDCSPSLGLITVNALTAADSVIIPIQCEYFALEGLGKLLNTVKIIQNRLNPELDVEGLLLTMFDIRLRLSHQVVDEVRSHFENLVFDTVIHRNTKLGEAPSFGKPAIMYDAASRGANNYLDLARELLQKDDATKISTEERFIQVEDGLILENEVTSEKEETAI
jgi:chromosome partitioning protein